MENKDLILAQDSWFWPMREGDKWVKIYKGVEHMAVVTLKTVD